MNRRIAFIPFALLLGVAAAGVLAEGAARVYVYGVAEQGKLFEPDPVLGWKTIPNLDLRRRNADGDPWTVRTNARGYRSPADRFPQDAPRRVLVLGDSYAFGEGIEEEDRFDSLLARRFPTWTFVNQAVMGFGTDQQLIGIRAIQDQLQAGDVILLVTYVNDFIDLLRHSHSGRGKPWFSLEEGDLVEHAPELGTAEWLRDRSYVLARVFQWSGDRAESLTLRDLRYGGHLYRHLVLAETADARARGVEVLIAHHDTASAASARLHAVEEVAQDAIDRTCQEPGIDCLALDPTPMGHNPDELLLCDGHWGTGANRLVSEQISAALSESDELR